MKNIKVKVATLADRLDKLGMRAEADELDNFLKTAKLPPFLEECPGCGGAMKKGAKMCKKCAGKKEKK